MGVRYEGNDLVTWSSQGDLARWELPAPRSSSVVNGILSCLPLRLDAPSGGQVDPARAQQEIADYLAKGRFEPCTTAVPPGGG